jgi:hypothetical protein
MKQLILVGAIFLLHASHLYTQKNSNNTVSKETIHNAAATCFNTFQMTYPLNMDKSTIIAHYGKNYFGSSCYFNEGLTFTTKLNSVVTCNVDEAIVSSISYDDGMYMLFLKKDNYTIVLCNLKTVKVKQGVVVKLGDLLGTLAPNEEDHQKGCLELMLFEGNKVRNPEKYIINSLSPPAISTIT